jgi:hypothetical protein
MCECVCSVRRTTNANTRTYTTKITSHTRTKNHTRQSLEFQPPTEDLEEREKNHLQMCMCPCMYKGDGASAHVIRREQVRLYTGRGSAACTPPFRRLPPSLAHRSFLSLSHSLTHSLALTLALTSPYSLSLSSLSLSLSLSLSSLSLSLSSLFSLFSFSLSLYLSIYLSIYLFSLSLLSLSSGKYKIVSS